MGTYTINSGATTSEENLFAIGTYLAANLNGCVSVGSCVHSITYAAINTPGWVWFGILQTPPCYPRRLYPIASKLPKPLA
jgi:hypothetical protein